VIAPFVHHWIMARRESLNALNEVTLIVPFYRNVEMLKRQVEEWNKYPEGVKIICVDDGSPEPALPIIRENSARGCYRLHDIELYRIGVDKPWNRGGARNLGAKMAQTEWILQIDIDHILPVDAARALLGLDDPNKSPYLPLCQRGIRGGFQIDINRWYRFPRWRVGKADDTRKKDQIANDQEYGQIHPHVDSYLVRRDVYWSVGGYNEDYSGAIGGGNPFLRRLEAAQPVDMLPAPIRLEVYTRDVIKDASDWSLPRDPSEYSRRKRIIERDPNKKPKNPIRFPWTREL
jgi:glycosyltransferase involved in cell wall biosynthesis